MLVVLDELIERCAANGKKQIALAGRGEIAEIAMLCASQFPVEVVAIVDSGNEPIFLGVPVHSDIASAGQIDAVIVTDMTTAQETYDLLNEANLGCPVLAPRMLRIAQQRAPK